MNCALYVHWQDYAHAAELVKDGINRDVPNLTHISSLGVLVQVYNLVALMSRSAVSVEISIPNCLNPLA